MCATYRNVGLGRCSEVDRTLSCVIVAAMSGSSTVAAPDENDNNFTGRKNFLYPSLPTPNPHTNFLDVVKLHHPE